MALIYPAEADTKLRAFAFASLALLAASFLRLRSGGRRPGRRATFSDAEDRELRDLPSIRSLDVARPILALTETDSGMVTIYLVALEGEGRGRARLVPVRLRGRVKDPIEYESVLEVRDFLRGSVIAQSEFSDRAAVELFGADWSDYREWR